MPYNFTTELDREPSLTVSVQAHFFDGDLDSLEVYSDSDGSEVELTYQEQETIAQQAENEREKWAMEPNEQDIDYSRLEN